ncbi:pyridoxal phosphate-dependent decarboxylase family protein [Actinokineospora bangkokensis]|uniref:Aspartate aminotransferase family protein n=1 Tax=Actinokineospora bangkokensis TaxID=1193682 RepID=A0A1Q9LSL3_9PSEU|nr:pyridoxal-dependent decarboxylase [Actinokineospora bangkokensis]OLR95008.1 aspartate aminotransferase family protein [Actinokineospora bangkokensis]
MTRSPAALAAADAVRPLVAIALDAVAAGAAARGGPLPPGGPGGLGAGADPVPERGVGAEAALRALVARFAAGAADPADPWCAAHLHCPPLAVAAAADLVASVLNPSMDSWDQAPAASELEAELTRGIARLCHPGAAAPDALVTTGGTESNLLGLLLARESRGRVTVVCGRNAHHSVTRAAWLLGLPAPVPVDCAGDRVDPASLAAVLARVDGPAAVVATLGTTNTGALDPLPEIEAAAVAAGAWLHVDAAYAGGLLFSGRRALPSLARADSVALDLHKFGWQPIAAGLLVCRDAGVLRALHTTADYLSADDDTEAGLPDLLGRSLRTSRRPDAFKIAVTLRALGRAGIGELVDHCCDTAAGVAAAARAHPALRVWGEPSLSTVLFRPADTPDAVVAQVRRDLLRSGRAVVGRADLDGELWLKLTILHPHATAETYAPLLDLVADAARRAA